MPTIELQDPINRKITPVDTFKNIDSWRNMTNMHMISILWLYVEKKVATDITEIGQRRWYYNSKL